MYKDQSQEAHILDKEIGKRLTALARQHLAKFPQNVSSVSDFAMRKGFLLHQFNLRECYAYFMQSLGQADNSAKQIPELNGSQISKPNALPLDESLVTEKSIGNYQSYNYKPSYKVPKYMVSKASSLAKEEEDEYSVSNHQSYLKAFDR